MLLLSRRAAMAPSPQQQRTTCRRHQQQLQQQCRGRSRATLGTRATLRPGGSDGNDDEAPTPDIDQLASFLSQKAVEMRASLDELDINWSMEEPSAAADEAQDSVDPDLLSAAAAAAAALPGSALPAQADALSTVEMLEVLEDPDNFIPQDFAIVKLLGKLVMQDVASVEPLGSFDSSGASSSLEPPAPNMVVYAARYNSGLPYQGPVTVQLREYLPGSRRVALNEMTVQTRLFGKLPTNKWQAAAADPSRAWPVIRLLGYLEAPPSDEAFAVTADPADTLWCVYKWEGGRPLSLMLADIDVPEEPSGLQGMLMSKEAAVAAALQARHSLLRSIAEQLLSALSFCHQRGVAHCGLGTGSVVINTWQDKEIARMLVKLDNFGLSRCFPHPLETPQSADALASFAGSSSSSSGAGGVGSPAEDSDALQQRQEDLQAAGLLLTEVFMVGAAAAGAEVLDVPALKRLLFDVFHEDMALFKEWASQDEDNLGGFVEFMDEAEGAGWELLERLLAGQTAAGELLASCRFFTRASSDVLTQ